MKELELKKNLTISNKLLGKDSLTVITFERLK